MYFDEDDSCFFTPEYLYELETQDLPLDCPYRQMVPSPPFLQGPQGPQGPPGRPPVGPPGRPPSGPQGRPPSGHQGRPPSRPPHFEPSLSHAEQMGATPFAIDQGAIRPCTFRFVYIWPRRGPGFWAWLTFVGRRSIAGFRWQRNNWRYFGMDLRDIRSFECF